MGIFVKAVMTSLLLATAAAAYAHAGYCILEPGSPESRNYFTRVAVFLTGIWANKKQKTLILINI